MPKRRQKKQKTTRSKKVEIRILSARKDRENKEENQPAAVMVNKNKFDSEKAEQKNRLIMWVGISCLMAAFFVIWIFNLKNEFKASVSKGGGNELNWSQTKAELDKVMKQVKQGLAQIKQIQKNSSQNTLSGPLRRSSSEASEPKLTSEQINLLKGKLLSEVASSTATSTKK